MRRIEDAARSATWVRVVAVGFLIHRLNVHPVTQVEDKPLQQKGVAAMQLMHPLTTPLKDPWVSICFRPFNFSSSLSLPPSRNRRRSWATAS